MTDGIHDECGHADEAHGASSEGCAHCECAQTLGREGEGSETTVGAPVAEGGAQG